MVEFNLLPWREYQKNYEAKKTITFFVATNLILIGLIFLSDFIMQSYIQAIQSRIDEMHEQLAEKMQQTLMEDAKERIVKQLEQSQENIMNILIYVKRSKHDGTCLSSLEKKNNKVMVDGYARSLVDIMLLTKAWQASTYFSSVNITQSKYIAHNNYAFHVEALVKDSASWKDIHAVAKNISAE